MSAECDLKALKQNVSSCTKREPRHNPCPVTIRKLGRCIDEFLKLKSRAEEATTATTTSNEGAAEEQGGGYSAYRSRDDGYLVYSGRNVL